MRKFDSKNELKSKKSNNLKIVISMIIAVTLVIIGYSFATFTTHPQDLQIISNQVGEFIGKDIILSVVVDGEQQNAFPEKENNRFLKLECDNNSTGTWDKDKWQLSMDFTHPDKCTIYFHNKSFVPDLSGNNHNGTSTAAVWDNEGITLSANTQYGYIDTGIRNHQFANGYTMITRLRFNQFANSNQNIFSYWEDVGQVRGGGFGWHVNTGGLWANTLDGNKRVDTLSNNRLVLNKWYTLIVRNDKKSLKIYIDGEEKGSSQLSSNHTLNSPQIYFGSTVANQAFVTLSYALIYDRAIEESEISNFTEIVNEDFKKDNLLLYYNFM